MRKLKKEVVYALYGFMGLAVLVTIPILKKTVEKPQTSQIMVTTPIVDKDTLPVFLEDENIAKPYNSDLVNINIDFYDYEDIEEKQQKSLIFYENTYIPSTGIDYTSTSQFDVLSIYNGKVVEITSNDMLGSVVKVEYGDIIGLYQCISDISVNLGDTVSKGTILGKSSTCNLLKGNNLYFELIHNGEMVNPEKYYDKTINEL